MFITNVSGVALPSSSAFGTSGAKTSKSEYQIYIYIKIYLFVGILAYSKNFTKSAAVHTVPDTCFHFNFSFNMSEFMY